MTSTGADASDSSGASEGETGGDAPCWAHLFDDAADESTIITGNHALVVDLGSDRAGPSGAVWSLPHGGDLNANLIRLDPGGGIDIHVNNEVDVLVFVQSGSGELSVEDEARQLGTDHLALIPKGAARSIRAGLTGITYLSVHRRRSPLGITRPDHDGDR